MRAFIALELPADFADDTAAAARRLSASLEGRFLDRSTYHLTLAFLGDIDDAEASRAMDALGRPADATLWLGVAPDPALQALAERVREELTARDVPFDPKPFRPHITLGRRVRIPKKPLPPLAFPLPAHARTVTLFKSTLSRDGAEYKPLYTVELGEPAEMPTSTPN